MKYQYFEKTMTWVVLPALFILMFLASAAYGQSAHEDALSDLPGQPTNFEAATQPPNRLLVVGPNASNFQVTLIGASSARPWWQTTSQSPLPPASAFALQTNLNKYLDTWPTPGTTVSANEPPEEELTDEALM